MKDLILSDHQIRTGRTWHAGAGNCFLQPRHFSSLGWAQQASANPAHPAVELSKGRPLLIIRYSAEEIAVNLAIPAGSLQIEDIAELLLPVTP